VPLDGNVITDDGRIVASVTTIKALTDLGAKVVVLAHLGRPKGMADPKYSLAPAAKRLGELLHKSVTLVPVVSGPTAIAAVANASAGEVLMLENVRFDPRETSKDKSERLALAKEWATLGDIFVSDGFGVVHREQASVTELALELPHAAGYLVETEAKVFSKVLSDPDRPYVVVLGGSKVSDKLGVIENLIKTVDRLVVGGGMCFTFLAAAGHEVGSSLLETDQVSVVADLVNRAKAAGVEIVIPVDVVVADKFAADAQTKVVSADQIPDGWMGLDIGPKTIELFTAALSDAKTIIWNGPMGVFEMPAFANGTKAIATAITKVNGTTVVGGGDSAAAVRLLGIPESGFTHISTGGGASLEYLEGKTLPGLAVLENN
jgi:phosphoglycerate kinase